jgi:hypothetical protein
VSKKLNINIEVKEVYLIKCTLQANAGSACKLEKKIRNEMIKFPSNYKSFPKTVSIGLCIGVNCLYMKKSNYLSPELPRL